MGHWQERLMRLLTADYCPLYLAWSPWRRMTTAAPLRRWASRCQGRGRWALLRWLFLLLLTVTWPLRLLWLSRQTTHAFAPTIRQRTGKAVWRQLGEQIWLGVRHALPPVAYYTYEFYRVERYGTVDDYLQQYEAGALLPWLNRDQHHPAMADKAHFAELCTEQRLPTVAILGICAAGRCDWLAPVVGDIFVKPCRGARGEGTQRWRWVAADEYEAVTGERHSWATVVATLAQLSQQQAYLVQPCLANHPTIAALAPDALSTVRLVTGRTPTGHVEAIVATFKMAWQPDIINTHGLNSSIALASGQLGRAYSYDPVCAGYDAHPVTGAGITGVILPDWPAAVALAQQAHALFPGYVFVGWDIALTPQGPHLLEGNAGWDVVTVQKPQGVGLAQTRFAELCHLWSNECAF